MATVFTLRILFLRLQQGLSFLALRSTGCRQLATLDPNPLSCPGSCLPIILCTYRYNKGYLNNGSGKPWCFTFATLCMWTRYECCHLYVLDGDGDSC
uniref:Secreted protein n=1 Tax=Octopus bimaculoides TaxID=37653 RepID=A0A0L8FMN7_OCTBM